MILDNGLLFLGHPVCQCDSTVTAGVLKLKQNVQHSNHTTPDAQATAWLDHGDEASNP